MSSGAAAGHRTAEASKRLTLSEILELLLTKSSSEHSSVTLSRNARGVTQIEVTVRTGDDGSIKTAADAKAHAQTLYDQLRSAYPMPDGNTGAVDP